MRSRAGSLADSVDSVMMMQQNPAYLLDEEPLQHHDEEESLPTRIDICTLRAMLDSLPDEAAVQTPPGLLHQMHNAPPRGSSCSSIDLSFLSEISLHNNSIFSSEDSCCGNDTSPMAKVPSPSKPFLSPTKIRRHELHELHEMKLAMPFSTSPSARVETF